MNVVYQTKHPRILKKISRRRSFQVASFLQQDSLLHSMLKPGNQQE